ncbi:peroxide stress protein YaaA [Undibacterium sp. Ren11W]|uniref:peroxide stress protein YaaA n=1 Tax=Undibacterium sp. Ren11W TaxID=3413045 RepID=UPI003BF0E092
MLIVLSPAKSLNFETIRQNKKNTIPQFLDDASELIHVAKNLTPIQLQSMMAVSPSLAQLNVDRFSSWEREHSSLNSKQAVYAFNGDVYEGLDITSLKSKALDYLQDHLNILSGLYGVLRPFDLMQAYRLEMGSRLENQRGRNLYAFWGAKVTNNLNEKFKKQKNKILINLASEEYFKVVKPALLEAATITPIFRDYKNGKYKIISFYAKRARGMMARYCAQQGISQAEDLMGFDSEGYAYCQEESDSHRWVFQRRLAD